MRLPPPADYLQKIEPTLRLHLFAEPDDLLKVLHHFHPGVKPEHILEWRARYRSKASHDDRRNMLMMEAERRAIVNYVDRMDAAGTPSREYRRTFDAYLLRPGFHRSRAISAATYVPSETTGDRHGWTLEEDTKLLAGGRVRDEEADESRLHHLTACLSPEPPEGLPDTPAEPSQEPTAQTETAPDPGPASDSLPGPAVSMNLGSGASVELSDDLSQAIIVLGGDGVEYSQKQLATVISRLTVVHDMMEV